MAVKPLAIAITAQDETSKVIDGVNKRLKAFQSPMAKALEATNAFGRASGLVGVAQGFGAVEQHAFRAVSALSAFAPALSAVAGAGSLAGMAALVNQWGKLGAQTSWAAQRAGTSVEGLDQLRGAMQLAGGSAEGAATGITTFRDTLTDAIGGQNQSALMYLNQFNIKFRGVGLTARNVMQVLPEALEALHRIDDPSLRARVANTWFGGSADDFMRLSALGVRSYQDMMDQAKSYGLWTKESADAAKRFEYAQTQASLATTGLGVALGTALEPEITPLIAAFAKWEQANKDVIATGFRDFVHGVHEDVVAVTPIVKAVATAADSVADSLGGWHRVMEALLIYTTGKWALGMIGAITRVGGAAGIGAAGAGGGGALGLASKVIGAGLLADVAVTAFDPKDAFGAWLDKRFPIASFLDNAASRIGMGRSYAEQERVDEALHPTDATPGERRRGQGALWPKAAPLPTGEADARARYAFDRYVSQGDTPQAAAGRVANLVIESGMNDRAVGDGGAAYGLGQHHAAREKAFVAMFGHDMRHGSFDEQLDFFRRDPDVGAQRANQLIARPGTSAGAAAAQISRLNERPADESGEMQRRAALAETLLRQYMPAQGSARTLDGSVGQLGSGGQLKISVDVNHGNAPPGSSVSVRAAGDGVQADRPRVHQGMQLPTVN